MGIISIISTVFKFLLNFFLNKNTKEMKDQKIKQQTQDKKDEINKAIEDRDIDKIRREISE
jgi:hypothetical protein